MSQPQFVIRVVSLAGRIERPGTDEPPTGYIVGFDTRAYEGRGAAVLSDTVDGAQRFSSAAEAFAFWRQDHGMRSDGKPNRPLTAFNISVERVPGKLPESTDPYTEERALEQRDLFEERQREAAE